MQSPVCGLQPTLEYFIDDQGDFSWGGHSAETADEALGTGEPRKERDAHQLENAQRFLQRILENGPMASNDIHAKAQQLNISRATLWRAKEVLAIKASKERGTGEWLWRLP